MRPWTSCSHTLSSASEVTTFWRYIHKNKKWQNLPISVCANIATFATSGAGTNLKVGASVRREAPGKILGVVLLHFFGSKSTISRFGECFRDGQYSLVSFLFAILRLTVPPVPSYL